MFMKILAARFDTPCMMGVRNGKKLWEKIQKVVKWPRAMPWHLYYVCLARDYHWSSNENILKYCDLKSN